MINYLFCRIADEMKTEGNFEHEPEAASFKDLKPTRPLINRFGL